MVASQSAPHKEKFFLQLFSNIIFPTKNPVGVFTLQTFPLSLTYQSARVIIQQKTAAT